MDLHGGRHPRSTLKAALGGTAKEGNGRLTWWRSKCSNLADLSTNSSSASTSKMSSTSRTPARRRTDTPTSSANPNPNRLLFDDSAVLAAASAAAVGGGGGGQREAEEAASEQRFETQQKPPRPEGYQLSRGSRAGTELLSPDEDDYDDALSASAPAPSLKYSHGSTARRRRSPQRDLDGSSSGKLKSLKLAPTGSGTTAASDGSSGTPEGARSGSGGRSDGRESAWTNSLGLAKGLRREQLQQRRRGLQEEQGRTRSVPSRPQEDGRTQTAEGAAKGREMEGEFAAPAGGGGGGSGGNREAGEGCGNVDDKLHEEEVEDDALEGLDDDVIGIATKPNVVYDILAVDRGWGLCDTSLVPFAVEEGRQVATTMMRAFTSGQSEFLARRGFAAGLVSHFLEETNSEFRVLQGGGSPGMNARQLHEAAVSLEAAFVPAVKRLRGRPSTDVVLDSLFEGVDDAGGFVVRFEVSITRCHPEDIESSSSSALRECSRAIREAIREEGVAEQSTHEVVFVGRPMWELVSPVLDFSPRAAGKAATLG